MSLWDPWMTGWGVLGWELLLVCFWLIGVRASIYLISGDSCARVLDNECFSAVFLDLLLSCVLLCLIWLTNTFVFNSALEFLVSQNDPHILQPWLVFVGDLLSRWISLVCCLSCSHNVPSWFICE